MEENRRKKRSEKKIKVTESRRKGSVEKTKGGRKESERRRINSCKQQRWEEKNEKENRGESGKEGGRKQLKALIGE